MIRIPEQRDLVEPTDPLVTLQEIRDAARRGERGELGVAIVERARKGNPTYASPIQICAQERPENSVEITYRRVAEGLPGVSAYWAILTPRTSEPRI